MNLSLNEVDALCYKAARGFGMSWGLAEEAGKAVRWLVVNGLPGPEALANLLDQLGDPQKLENTPRLVDGCWDSTGAGICAITAGAALSDAAIALSAEGSVTLKDVIEPLLLLPFAASVSRRLGRKVNIVCGSHPIEVSPHTFTQSTNDRVYGTLDCIFSLKSQPERIPAAQHPPYTRADISAEVLDRLNTYAHRTYAPATEASRLLGAG